MTEKIEEFCRLLQFPEVQEVLKEIVRTSLHESNVFTRLNLIEEHLGADEFHCIIKDIDYEDGISKYDEERIPVTPIRQQIAEMYTIIDSKPTIIENKTILSGNKTETRARLLFDYIKKIPLINGKRFMTGPEVAKWLLNVIEEEHRPTKNGSRQASRDVMEKTRELYPDEINVYLVSDKQNHKRGKNIIEYIGIVEHVSAC